MLRARLAVLRSRGGTRAGFFWLLRKVIRLDVYDVLAHALRPGFARVPGVALLEIAATEHIERTSSRVIATLDAHCGLGVAETIRRGGRIYALLGSPDLVLAQVRIELHRSHVDTPANLELDVGPGNAFLSFLYTPPQSRGAGHASTLVRSVCARLAEEGLHECVCHVQTTNVASVNAFHRSGWRRVGWMIATAGGRFIASVPNSPKTSVRLRARPLGPQSFHP